MRRMNRDDAGITAVLVTVGMTTLLLIAALALDVGTTFFNRARAQNSADARALAAAINCASGKPIDTAPLPDLKTVPAGYDQELSLDVTSCDVPGLDSVTATVSQEQDFQFIPGSVTVFRNATAKWGQLGAGVIFPFTFSLCAFPDSFTYGTSATQGTPMMLYGQTNRTSCARDSDTTGQHSSSKGFVADGCVMKSVGDTITDSRGNNFGGTGCASSDLDDYIGRDVLVPIWDTGDGASATKYHVATLAFFHVLGWSGNGSDKGGAMSGRCKASNGFTGTVAGDGNKPCLYGYLIKLTAPGPVLDAPCGGALPSACAVKLTK